MCNIPFLEITKNFLTWFKSELCGIMEMHQSDMCWLCNFIACYGFFLTLSNQIKMVRVIVFNATFNNISVISWRSVLFVEETEVPRENHRPAASH